MRRAARKDTNHDEVVEFMVAHGWAHERVSQTGFPDEIFLRPGQVRPVEIKTERGSMEAAQVELHQRWERAGVRIPVVTSGEECLAVLSGHRAPRTYRDFPWEGISDAEKRRRLALRPGHAD